MEEKVYLLYHMYQRGDTYEDERWKLLGIYTGKKEYEEAIDRYYSLDGFNKYSRDCFIAVEYALNKDSEWTDGFFSSGDEGA